MTVIDDNRMELYPTHQAFLPHTTPYPFLLRVGDGRSMKSFTQDSIWILHEVRSNTVVVPMYFWGDFCLFLWPSISFYFIFSSLPPTPF